MPLSRERAVDLSRQMVDRLAKTPGVELLNETEYVRNQILQALLGWDKETDKIAAEIKQKLSARARKVPEGSREWELLFAEELERALHARIARGE